MTKVINNKGIRSVIVLMVVASQFVTTIHVLGQAWKEELSAPPMVYWCSAASSADATKLVALGNSAPTGASAMYSSIDSGETWTSNSPPFAIWSALASSSDGNKLVAVACTGSIWTSTNSGTTWIAATNAPALNWSSVASSSDGVRLIAAAVSDQIYTFTNGQQFPSLPVAVRANGSVYTSTDSGVTWQSNNIPCNCFVYNPGWNCVASSTNGNQLFVAGGGDGIYHSTNGGAGWTEVNSPADYIVSVVTSADGGRLLARGIDLGTNIWAYSTNSGQSWDALIAPPGVSSSHFLASSADGIKLVAAGGGSPIYTSTDSGQTWIANPDPRQQQGYPPHWCSVASSADGDKLIALADWGKIYTWQYQPTLRLAISATNAVVSWPCSPFASGFVLQHSSNLCTPDWADIATPSTNDGINLSVRFDSSINAQYFRLKK